MGEDDTTGVADRIPQRHRPQVLESNHQRRTSVGKLVDQVCRDRLGNGHRIGVDHGSCLGHRHCTFFSSHSQTDQGGDCGTQLGPLLIVETGNRQHIDLVAITGHEHGIDHPNLSRHH